jgi:hypothetical protein
MDRAQSRLEPALRPPDNAEALFVIYGRRRRIRVR